MLAAALLLSVTLVTDEPEAVLAILDKRATGQTVAAADWQHLFATEGYIRLKKRELSMKRSFEEDTFRTFVLSDDLLAKRAILARTLADWKRADLSRAASMAQAYLPPGAKIDAKIYPSIKPATNSFVFELDTDPAIFKYIEDEPRERFEQIIAHEMHHVGYRGACRGNDEDDFMRWLGAFGEGFAVLAAAGGPDHDPQRHSGSEVQAEWKRQMAGFEKNFREVEAFLIDVANGLPAEEQQRHGFAFYGVQGPWYSVGWKMAVVIEKTLGREKLVEVMCDRSKLLATYNRASDVWFERTGERLPKWPASLSSRPPR